MYIHQHGTTTETNEDRARGQHRQTKTEVDEDEDIYKGKERCTLGWSKVAALLQMTTAPEWQRWRQTKKKTYALCGRGKQQLPFRWRLPQSDEDGGRWRRWTHSGVEESGSSLSADDFPGVRKTELDTSPPTWLADSRTHGGCSSLCSPRTVPVASFLNLLSVRRIAKERWQSLQVVPTCMTED